MLNFAQLGEKFPPETVVWGGFGLPLTINANRVTGDAVTPETNVLEFYAKLLEAAIVFQTELNEQRTLAGLPPVAIVAKTIGQEGGNPTFTYTFKVTIASGTALNNLLIPDTSPAL
ncbi:MAG: hypothetical protein B0A82_26940 [Alkalinema sp. CACIAM 70d]|nr:MAG: hypothetical protein B0A82_26940 [Alkalinema sp. CACIAM 70d]